MKRFELLLCSLLAGCASDDSVREHATLSASWTFKNFANNASTGCPPGPHTVTLHRQPIDADGKDLGPATSEVFDCELGTGMLGEIMPGIYNVMIRVAETSGGAVYSESLPQKVDLTAADGSVQFEILNDGGYFYMPIISLWGLMTNSSLSCAEAGASTIIIEASGSQGSVSFEEHCGRYATTSGLLAGTYTLRVSARDAQNQSLGSAPAQMGINIHPQNTVTWLDPLTIDLPNH